METNSDNHQPLGAAGAADDSSTRAERRELLRSLYPVVRLLWSENHPRCSSVRKVAGKLRIRYDQLHFWTDNFRTVCIKRCVCKDKSVYLNDRAKSTCRVTQYDTFCTRNHAPMSYMHAPVVVATQALRDRKPPRGQTRNSGRSRSGREYPT